LGFGVWGFGFLVYLEGAHVAPVLVPRVGHKPVVLALKMRGKVSRNWTLMVRGGGQSVQELDPRVQGLGFVRPPGSDSLPEYAVFQVPGLQL
jgi:hypothetical protein